MAELLVAEAKVESAFADAIKTGQVNDYYKHKMYKGEKKSIENSDEEEYKDSKEEQDSEHDTEQDSDNDTEHDSHH